jgi:hypothetical protein
MAAQFECEVRAELGGEAVDVQGTRTGFFAWVDGAPAEGYRAPRTCDSPVEMAVPSIRRKESATDSAPPDAESATDSLRQNAEVWILTGEYGARVLRPLVDDLAVAAGAPIEVLAVPNRFFGGNIAVTGLLTGPDVARALDAVRPGARVLLPDVVLSNGRFLDGTTPDDLPRRVEVVATDGGSLVRAIRVNA